jgi:hypothetical protein
MCTLEARPAALVISGSAEKGQKQWWLPSSICGSLIH